MSRLLTVSSCLLALAGCSDNAEDGAPAAGAIRVLTAADLESFLSVVQSREGALIPEFTPPDEDPSLDLGAPAQELAASFRSQCRQLFDTERQGAIWQRDTEWAGALKTNNIPPARFAELVRDVSLAIMRVRLEARVDPARLVAQARRQLDRARRTMDRIDEVPLDERTRKETTLRTR